MDAVAQPEVSDRAAGDFVLVGPAADDDEVQLRQLGAGSSDALQQELSNCTKRLCFMGFG